VRPTPPSLHEPGGGGGTNPPPVSTIDKFGVREIYPTAPEGREWYVDMSDPTKDPALVISSATGTPITKNADGTWRDDAITGSDTEGVRMEVTTPSGEALWKNVEITGYVRLVKGASPDRFSWYGRSGVHSDNDPCDGTAYHMQLGYDGSAWYQKEIWHTGGYTPERRGQLAGVVPQVLGVWVGFKAMIYNVDGDAHVANEIWVDPAATNAWTKVNGIVDTGGWVGSQQGCKRAKDAILNWARPIATFRADNALFDFKSLSIREISAP
jgi:hypothetical protein